MGRGKEVRYYAAVQGVDDRCEPKHWHMPSARRGARGERSNNARFALKNFACAWSGTGRSEQATRAEVEPCDIICRSLARSLARSLSGVRATLKFLPAFFHVFGLSFLALVFLLPSLLLVLLSRSRISARHRASFRDFHQVPPVNLVSGPPFPANAFLPPTILLHLLPLLLLLRSLPSPQQQQPPPSPTISRLVSSRSALAFWTTAASIAFQVNAAMWHGEWERVRESDKEEG